MLRGWYSNPHRGDGGGGRGGGGGGQGEGGDGNHGGGDHGGEEGNGGRDDHGDHGDHDDQVADAPVHGGQRLLHAPDVLQLQSGHVGPPACRTE